WPLTAAAPAQSVLQLACGEPIERHHQQEPAADSLATRSGRFDLHSIHAVLHGHQESVGAGGVGCGVVDDASVAEQVELPSCAEPAAEQLRAEGGRAHVRSVAELESLEDLRPALTAEEVADAGLANPPLRRPGAGPRGAEVGVV